MRGERRELSKAAVDDQQGRVSVERDVVAAWVAAEVPAVLVVG
jgi:hypothetical protein